MGRTTGGTRRADATAAILVEGATLTELIADHSG